MKCEELRRRWHACLDENRDDPEVDSHLASCDDCQRYVDLMSQIVGTLDELHEATEPVVATRDFEPLAQPAPRRRVHWNVVFRRVTAMAAVIAAVIGGWLYFANTRTPIPVDPEERLTQVNGPVEPEKPKPTDSRLGISLRGDSVGKFLVVSKETSEPDADLLGSIKLWDSLTLRSHCESLRGDLNDPKLEPAPLGFEKSKRKQEEELNQTRKEIG